MGTHDFPLTALITDACGDTGGATARLLAEVGHRLVLVGCDKVRLQRLKSEIDHSDRHIAIAGDLQDEKQREALAGACEHLPGGVDVLINNAGSTLRARLEDTGNREIDGLLDTNLRLPIALTRDLLPALRRSEFGTVIIIGSVYGHVGQPGFSVCGASQFGLHGFSEALRRELGDRGIAVHYLALRNRPGSPQRAAHEVLRLMQRSHSGLHFIGWTECLLIKLNALFPSLLDRALSGKRQ